MSRLPIEFLQHIRIEMTYLVKRSINWEKIPLMH
jgi:hypothetical protein